MAVLIPFIAYILGSIPFGLLLGFLAGKDVRQYGSHNIGATNVWRVCGRKWGVAAFILDFAKGLVAVLIVGRLFPGSLAAPYPQVLAAIGAVFGHNFPVWLRFKGGKGVATSAGVVAGLMPLPFAIAMAVFVLTVIVSHYLSLGSMLASVALVVAALALLPSPFGADLPLIVLSLLLCVMILFRHRQNIGRILNGTENRFPPPKS